jgi:arsenite methyltransferase
VSVTGDLRALPFRDGMFDVGRVEPSGSQRAGRRAAALVELTRVLAPGGWLLLQDIGHTARYAETLRAAGLSDVRRSGLRFGLFPPVRFVESRKPFNVI